MRATVEVKETNASPPQMENEEMNTSRSQLEHDRPEHEEMTATILDNPIFEDGVEGAIARSNVGPQRSRFRTWCRWHALVAE